MMTTFHIIHIAVGLWLAPVSYTHLDVYKRQDESLFRSEIHPCRRVSSLSKKESRKLYRAIREVLAEGIACGGTTTRDYRDARGAAGSFQEQLAVYGCLSLIHI